VVKWIAQKVPDGKVEIPKSSYLIQTLFNSSFNIRRVQNLNFFIDHLKSQNTCASTTLKWEFSILEDAFLVHTYMAVRRYRENCKPQGIII